MERQMHHSHNVFDFPTLVKVNCVDNSKWHIMEMKSILERKRLVVLAIHYGEITIL